MKGYLIVLAILIVLFVIGMLRVKKLPRDNDY